jgi:carbamoylphosphate synthase large subunit
MEKINLYFTRSFSANYYFINSVRKYFKENNYDIQIIVSHPDKESPTLMAADVPLIEPSFNAEENEYFFENVCKDYDINCIIPGESSILTLIKPDSFVHKIKIKVLSSQKFDFIQILRSKTETYKLFAINKILNLNIPFYKLVKNSSTFETAYQEITKKEFMACFKPDISQGGSGFRIIDNKIGPKDIISGYVTVRNTYDYYLHEIKKLNTFPPLIVLQYISGFEYSIDCLGDGENLLFCGIREKSDKKRRLVKNNILESIAKEIQAAFKFSYLYNIQIRAENGTYYLLEINPRYSAGSYIYELEGYNLLGKAIEISLLNHKIKPIQTEQILIQNIENYIKILNNNVLYI